MLLAAHVARLAPPISVRWARTWLQSILLLLDIPASAVCPFSLHHDQSRRCGIVLDECRERGATYMVCRGADRADESFTAQRGLTTSPTCRRLTPDFALFPGGYRDSFLLTVVSHQKARSRPRQSYRPLTADTLGGRVHRESYRTHERGRIRPTTPCEYAEHETTVSCGTNLRFCILEKAPRRF